MKIKVYSLAVDGIHGTVAGVHMTERAAYEQLRCNISMEIDERVNELLEANEFNALEEYLREECADPMDTWQIEEQYIEVPLIDELVTGLKRAEAAFEDIRMHWSPNGNKHTKEYRNSIADDHAAISAALAKAKEVTP